MHFYLKHTVVIKMHIFNHDCLFTRMTAAQNPGLKQRWCRQSQPLRENGTGTF